MEPIVLHEQKSMEIALSDSDVECLIANLGNKVDISRSIVSDNLIINPRCALRASAPPPEVLQCHQGQDE